MERGTAPSICSLSQDYTLAVTRAGKRIFLLECWSIFVRKATEDNGYHITQVLDVGSLSKLLKARTVMITICISS